MGGRGSGRRWQYSGQPTVSDFRSIDVRRWSREGRLAHGSHFDWSWYRDGAKSASIRVQIDGRRCWLTYRAREPGGEWKDMRYPVRLDATPCILGGKRDWFLCPATGCGARVALLYGGSVFACRRCHGLAYESQREGPADRAARRADKIRGKLGWEPGILNMPGAKPSGMHWRTFHRLTEEHDRLADLSVTTMMGRFLDPADHPRLRD